MLKREMVGIKLFHEWSTIEKAIENAVKLGIYEESAGKALLRARITSHLVQLAGKFQIESGKGKVAKRKAADSGLIEYKVEGLGNDSVNP